MGRSWSGTTSMVELKSMTRGDTISESIIRTRGLGQSRPTLGVE